MQFQYALSASAIDPGQLHDDLSAFAAMGVGELVVDVMDGVFAPAYGFGHRFVESVAEMGVGIACHVHLMANEPARRIEGLVQAGASVVTVHVEACVHAHRILDKIRSLGAQPGIALRPATPLTAIEYLLPGADRAVLMTDEPGFAARAPIPSAYERVKLLRDALNYRELTTRIEVKAAADAYTIARLMTTGAHGVILEAPAAGPAAARPLISPDSLAALQRDALARSRALDLA